MTVAIRQLRQGLSARTMAGRGLVILVALSVGAAACTGLGLVVLCLFTTSTVAWGLAQYLFGPERSGPLWGITTALSVWYVLIGSALSRFLPQADSVSYYRTALWVAGQPDGQLMLPSGDAGREGYIQALAFILRLGSPSFIVPIAFSAGALALAFLVTYRIVETTGSSRAARPLLPLFALSPSILIWGAEGLRESAVYLLLVVLASLATSYSRKPTIGTLAAFALVLVGLLRVRGPMAPVVAAGFALGLLFTEVSGKYRRQLRAGALFVVAAGAGTFLHYGGSEKLQQSYANLDRLDHVRAALGSANTGFATGTVSPGSFANGLSHVLFGPYPWEWPHLLAFVPDTLCWYLVITSLVLCFRRKRLRLHMPTTFAFSFILLSMSVSVTNYGTMVRLRTMAYVLALPIVCEALIGLRSVKSRRGDGEESRSVVPA